MKILNWPRERPNVLPRICLLIGLIALVFGWMAIGSDTEFWWFATSSWYCFLSFLRFQPATPDDVRIPTAMEDWDAEFRLRTGQLPFPQINSNEPFLELERGEVVRRVLVGFQSAMMEKQTTHTGA